MQTTPGFKGRTFVFWLLNRSIFNSVSRVPHWEVRKAMTVSFSVDDVNNLMDSFSESVDGVSKIMLQCPVQWMMSSK